MACTTQKTARPVGTLVPFSRFSDLANRYDQEIDARHDEIEIRMELPKTAYASDETIEFSITVINKSDRESVILRPDAETNRISTYPDGSDEIVFVVTPDDPFISLAFQGPAGSSGSLVTPPDSFVLLLPVRV